MWRALLLLGYPDQFPFLSAGGYRGPAFLWAQCSRPPDFVRFASALPVPLTPRSAGFLRAAAALSEPAARSLRVGPVIPHGVDTNLYRPVAAGRRDLLRRERGLGEAFVVGTVAAHSARKRLDLIVEAFARLRRRRPEARLLIKTDRRVSLDGADLGYQVRRHGVESSVRILLGEHSAEAMADLYRSMDAYLCLSEWEGFCLPVLEAMACGVPVVTHPVQGPGEIVPYRELLVPGSRAVSEGGSTLLQADPAQAARLLLRAAESPRLLKEAGERGRREAVEGYDMAKVAGLWAGLLESRHTAAAARGGPPARRGPTEGRG